MLKFIFLVFFISFNSNAFSESNEKPETCNFVQTDIFFYDYSFINSEDSNKSGMNNQILTARPGLEICFKTKHLNFRPNILINPFNSSTEGGMYIGKEFSKAEFGLYSSINYSQKTLGNNSNLKETVENNLLLGPYLYLFPNFSDESSLEILFRLSYYYYLNQGTVNGYTTTTSKKNGINFLTNLLYATFVNKHLAYTPSVNFVYTYSVDMVGGNIGSSVYQLQILPISFRWYLN
ncbi:hypothetical protein QEJ31_00020 [Pigmentibacter sp. JX0631]|uniref:hypothetical protein n=1 Tax=Pigmentibacter sp. JX0631 TaxID=2976982 RepID=UPI0024699623|nr:hypothetical protein [Pigmentibacter sp. JX0631]WGL59987.1 hypothetical protein QEJ31_00020 [Pigmentibacter sp. JX0631]